MNLVLDHIQDYKALFSFFLGIIMVTFGSLLEAAETLCSAHAQEFWPGEEISRRSCSRGKPISDC